jgi:hypothetical protein
MIRGCPGAVGEASEPPEDSGGHVPVCLAPAACGVSPFLSGRTCVVSSRRWAWTRPSASWPCSNRCPHHHHRRRRPQGHRLKRVARSGHCWPPRYGGVITLRTLMVWAAHGSPLGWGGVGWNASPDAGAAGVPVPDGPLQPQRAAPPRQVLARISGLPHHRSVRAG